jgi:hypothetical protein
VHYCLERRKGATAVRIAPAFYESLSLEPRKPSEFAPPGLPGIGPHHCKNMNRASSSFVIPLRLGKTHTQLQEFRRLGPPDLNPPPHMRLRTYQQDQFAPLKFFSASPGTCQIAKSGPKKNGKVSRTLPCRSLFSLECS